MLAMSHVHLAGAQGERPAGEQAQNSIADPYLSSHPAPFSPSVPPPQVLKVNGQPVNNLKDLLAAVSGSEGEYLSLDLEYNQVCS